MNKTMTILAAISIAFLLTVILTKTFIPVLVRKKLGQRILAIGPNWHKSKEGTPLMGGVFFIIAIVIAVTVVSFDKFFEIESDTEKLIICVLMALGFAFIGFLDDYIKMFKKRNKGLGAMGKLILQFVVAAGFLAVMYLKGYITTEMYIPVFDVYIDLGIMYYVFWMLVMVYIINCANLTDGIDGLAGSVAVIIMVLFILMGLRFENNDAVIYAASTAGALIGFLIFNFHPAKIFMGDTGSLFLGAVSVGLVFMLGNPLLIIPLSFIYIIEGLSVVLQVLSYKLTGKRIFKMSPIHHHFEKCGWSEVKIVGVFTFFTALFCALTYYFQIMAQ